MNPGTRQRRMPGWVAERLPTIVDACRRYHVERLYLYGSASTGRYRPGVSDLDFMVDFLPEARVRYDGHPRHRFRGMPDAHPYPANYRALTSALQDLFSDCPAADGRPLIDIGTYKCINNEHFKSMVDAQKIQLYAGP